jgi:SAM-dependent methyltransferase
MQQPCPVCAGTEFADAEILPAALIADWALTAEETALINRQQGRHCVACHANLRSMVLADAILAWTGTAGPLRVAVVTAALRGLRVLEVNQAGTLHPLLATLPNHVPGVYPETDITNLRFPDGVFDLVVHSDTLEHVPDPIRALAECLRVLRPAGAVCFTVPFLPTRFTKSRAGLPPSFHGPAGETRPDYLVHWEFGADAWAWPFRAGAGEVRLHTRDHPAAHAITALKPGSAPRARRWFRRS